MNLGKPAWIALMILGFIAWWPLGLVILAFISGSANGNGMLRIATTAGHWSRHGPLAVEDGAHAGQDGSHAKRMERERRRLWGRPRSSGNRAFDDYRAETLRRLEEEQREFKEFLERLRFAKDRAEFDQFMAERRDRPPEEPSDEGQQPQAG